MDELKKLKLKREAIRRLTKNLFQKIDEELFRENSIELEFCLEKLTDKEASLKELNLRVEFLCTDKDVFDGEIGCSEEWNENIIDYRTKINQKLKISSANNDITYNRNFPFSGLFPIITPPKNYFYSNNVESLPSINKALHENSQLLAIKSDEMEFVKSELSDVKQAITMQNLEKPNNCSISAIHSNIKKVKSIRGKRKTQCKDCNINVPQYVKHRSLVHNDPKPYKCSFCPFTSNGPFGLKCHIGIHTGERSLQCNICGVKFRFHSNLSRHLVMHSNPTFKKCHLCPKRFLRKDGLVKHSRTHDKMQLTDQYGVETGKPLTAKKASNNKNKTCKKENTTKKSHEDFKSQKTKKENKDVKKRLNHVKSIKSRGKWKSSLAATGLQITGGFTTRNIDKVPKIFLPCPDCKKRFRSALKFLDHRVTIHGASEPFKCPNCRYSSSLRNKFACHLRQHTGEKRFYCKICQKGFLYKTHLKHHERIHTVKKTYQCKYMYCEKRFIYRSSLANHEKLHATTDVCTKYQCGVCSKYFVNSASLGNHSRVHPGAKPYQCKVCLKNFTTLGNVTNHSRVHTGVKPHQCKVCLKTFTTLGNMTNHSRVHKGVKPHQCKVCLKYFGNMGAITNHSRVHKIANSKVSRSKTLGNLKSVSAKNKKGLQSAKSSPAATEDKDRVKPNQKRFPKILNCRDCKKRFYSADDYLNHLLKSHVASRIFQCPVCRYANTSKYNFYHHLQGHVVENRYHCKVCPKSFINKYQLADHDNFHTGERPYKCKYCDKRYTYRSNIKRHELIHQKPVSKSLNDPQSLDLTTLIDATEPSIKEEKLEILNNDTEEMKNSVPIFNNLLKLGEYMGRTKNVQNIS